jgi:[acyl-carrier-protein] S-malonyltransferase
MGRELVAFPGASDKLALADEILGFSLSRIMADADADELSITRHTQPALFVYSAVLWDALKPHADVHAAAGHSLGEYTALYASGVFTFKDALTLIGVRARGMDEAQPRGTCGMAAVIGCSPDELEDVIAEAGGSDVLEAANFNSPEQVVISGTRAALIRAEHALKSKKRVRYVPLPVSSAFHTSLMQPAQDALRSSLGQIPSGRPRFPVFANATAACYPDDPAGITALLVDQLVKPVRWEQTIRALTADGVNRFVEIGPGKVLSGLAKRIDKSLTVRNISDAAGLSDFLGFTL